MDSLTLALLLGIALVVIFLGSFIAKVFQAKRYQFYWMILPWLLAVIAVITTNIFQFDGIYAIAAGMIAFILSIEVVIGLGFMSAVTVAIASFAILVATTAGGLYALKMSGSEIQPIAVTAISWLPPSQYYNIDKPKKINTIAQANLLIDDLTIDYTDLDLLPNKVIQKPVLKSRIYREVNPRNVGAMKGANIRLLKTDGTVIKGNIIGYVGSKLMISKYIPQKGLIKAPIAISSIKKLEVME